MKIRAHYKRYEKDVTPESRYRVWEHVWSHIQKHELLELHTTQLETTALHISYYLASWGMFRNSELQTRNLDYFKEMTIFLFKVLPKKYPHFYESTFDDFEHKEFCEEFDEILNFIRNNIGLDQKPSDTLLSKILLGIWGHVPAYDRYFKDGIGRYFKENSIKPTKKFSGKSLNALWRVSKTEKWEKQFGNYYFICEGKRRKYPLAKQIDMAFFQLGLSASKK